VNETNSKVPAISVLLSCYNGARWLREAINSVLDQTFGDFEFIIVDDGSTDSSAEIIRHFAEQDTRIVVITKCNTGLVDSLNVGIQRASGEWIARIDADDICEPDRLESQLVMARLNPDLVFIGSDLLEIDENGNAIKIYRYPDKHSLLVRNLSSSRKFPPHSSAFYRADVVRSIGCYRFRIRRAQDWDLWLRLSEVGQLGSIDRPLVRIRKHLGQISHDESGRRQLVDSRVAIISYWLRHYGIPDPVASGNEEFNIFRMWVENRLEQEQLFEFFDYLAKIKKHTVEVYQSPSALLTATKHIVSEPGFLFVFLHTRLFGENIPHQLALEWMRKDNSCAVS